MAKLSAYELEREANIARNRAILEELEVKHAVKQLGIPSKSAPKIKAQPVQPSKRLKKEKDAPTRQSARLRKAVVDPDESPSKKRKREAEEEEKKAKEAEEQLEEQEKARMAKRPRHDDLDLNTLAETEEPEDLPSLSALLQDLTPQPKLAGDGDSFVFDADKKDANAISELREKLQDLVVVARAKVTLDRIYSAAYHPEISKDLIFFGDKHGQLGIWDARAPQNEVADEDGDVSVPDNAEGGKYWRLQQHWPATSKSSISTLKFDPVDSHKVFTSSYDCTIRSLSFTSGISQEIFSTDDVLISSFDLPLTGQEMWISDTLGGVTHLDLREDRSKTRWYGLSDQKIGCVSLNPTNPSLLLTSSNSRSLKIWDVRKLEKIVQDTDPTPAVRSPTRGHHGQAEVTPEEYDFETVNRFAQSKKGSGSLRGDWKHDKSVSSAYWDPRGRSIVSTSYDDTLRLWDIDQSRFDGSHALRSFRPFSQIKHNCQTGRWLTVLKAQWSANPDAYPHFTIGNMEHSLDIFSGKGDLITRLSDRKLISAVQAVTCSHPNVVERAASGNGSGRCVLWAPAE